MGIELNQNKYPQMKAPKNTSNGNPLQSDTQADFMQQLQKLIPNRLPKKNINSQWNTLLNPYKSAKKHWSEKSRHTSNKLPRNTPKVLLLKIKEEKFQIKNEKNVTKK